MSDKARRSNAWDDRHLTGVLWPVKAVVRAFSSITLAVCLLVSVMLYGISASVPVGLMALAPTYAIYGLSLLAAVAICAAAPVMVVRRMLNSVPTAARFLGTFVTFLACAGAGVFLWNKYAWPLIRYDAGTQHGLRLFAGFVEENKATTLRRLPGMEMSELEYYAWWPLRVILLMFVTNMVVATMRRIEFTFKNIGVLTVHTGIITIALGSIYYSGLKQEGDTLLLAGTPDPATGSPGIGPAQDAFYDNTRVALFVGEGENGWEQRLLQGLPRYNDYNLGALTGISAMEVAHQFLPWENLPKRDLSIPVPAAPNGTVDPDISLRIVGYATYADPIDDWVQAPTARGTPATPLRIVYMHSLMPDKQGRTSSDPVFAFDLAPVSPSARVSASDIFSVEYTMGPNAGMTEDRWRDLSEQLPRGTQHALVVEVPGTEGRPPFRAAYVAKEGESISVGDTGFKLEVKQLAPQPPFPIITEGYRGSTSSIAVVTVSPPKGDSFDRYVYHRFPQINQDMLKELKANGMPKRRDADPMIRISLVEADQLHVYIDEPARGRTRAIVRVADSVTVLDPLPADGRIPLGDRMYFRVGERWESATKVERPNPVPLEDRRKDSIGTHDNAMIAVEISTPQTPTKLAYSQIIWLPFTRYMSMGMGTERNVNLPDGRSVHLAFGRLEHSLPGFMIRLVDFQMLAYDHRGAPRDYQSVIRVVPVRANFETFDHVTKLNSPLRAPFEWDDNKSWVSQIIPKVASGMDPAQFKFSQAGWDQQGWAKTQAQVDQGMLKRPFASFTILGVGNSPGIHMIAAGGVLMGLGIPWAFYVKPWLVRREKKKIQEQLAAGTYKKPERPERVLAGKA